tara:strand:+ start:845 stop:1399 length:555 start_codon:yes stop_codon:yes gene_type:complete
MADTLRNTNDGTLTFDYVLPLSSTGTKSGPNSGNTLLDPIGPDGRGAITHRGNTNGSMSAVAIWLVEPQVDQFLVDATHQLGAVLAFNDPGAQDVVQDIHSVRWGISGLGDSSNVSLCAQGPRSLSGSVVVVMDRSGKAWKATLPVSTSITTLYFAEATLISESTGEQPWLKPLGGRLRNQGQI